MWGGARSISSSPRPRHSLSSPCCWQSFLLCYMYSLLGPADVAHGWQQQLLLNGAQQGVTPSCSCCCHPFPGGRQQGLLFPQQQGHSRDGFSVLQWWDVCASCFTVGKASPELPREGNCGVQLESVLLAGTRDSSLVYTSEWASNHQSELEEKYLWALCACI